MRFDRDPQFEAKLRQTPTYRKAMIERTRLLAAVIRAASMGFRATGYFERRIFVAAAGQASVQGPGDRGYRVELHDPFWHLIEYGSANNPPYAPVRRAVKALGWRFDDPRGPG